MNLSGLAAKAAIWLDFREGQGNTVYDRSGNGNHGTIVGGTWQRGEKGWEVGFDGVDDKITTGYVPPEVPITIAFILSGVAADFASVNRGLIELNDSNWGLSLIDKCPLLMLSGGNFVYMGDVSEYLNAAPHLWILEIVGIGIDDILDAKLFIDNTEITWPGGAEHSVAPLPLTKLNFMKTDYGWFKGSNCFSFVYEGILSSSQRTALYHHLMGV